MNTQLTKWQDDAAQCEIYQTSEQSKTIKLSSKNCGKQKNAAFKSVN